MSKNEILALLEKTGALIKGSHIVYTSGKHGSAYVNKDAVYPHTLVTSTLCLEIAKRFSELEIEVVLSPAVGGVILSQWIAYHLTQLSGKEVLGIYAEKAEDGQSFVIKRGYDRLCKGKRILIAEDILTTGGSVKKVIETAESIPSNIVGISSLCNRGGIQASDFALSNGSVPIFVALAEIPLEAWSEQDCPLCKANSPINIDVGKGREYLSAKRKKSG